MGITRSCTRTAVALRRAAAGRSGHRTTSGTRTPMGAWPDLHRLVMIEAPWQQGEQDTSETRYHISSQPPDARNLLQAVRSHWGVKLARVDIAFRENESRIHDGPAAHNMSLRRRLAPQPAALRDHGQGRHRRPVQAGRLERWLSAPGPVRLECDWPDSDPDPACCGRPARTGHGRQSACGVPLPSALPAGGAGDAVRCPVHGCMTRPNFNPVFSSVAATPREFDASRMTGWRCDAARVSAVATLGRSAHIRPCCALLPRGRSVPFEASRQGAAGGLLWVRAPGRPCGRPQCGLCREDPRLAVRSASCCGPPFRRGRPPCWHGPVLRPSGQPCVPLVAAGACTHAGPLIGFVAVAPMERGPWLVFPFALQARWARAVQGTEPVPDWTSSATLPPRLRVRQRTGHPLESDRPGVWPGRSGVVLAGVGATWPRNRRRRRDRGRSRGGSRRCPASPIRAWSTCAWLFVSWCVLVSGVYCNWLLR